MRRWMLMAMVCLADALHGQDYFYNADYLEPPLLVEMGVKSGIIAGLTDIGPKRSANFYFNELNTGSPGFYAGWLISALYQRKLAVTFSLSRGTLSGADSNSNAAGSQRSARNLHFETDYTEVQARLEVYPLSFGGEAGALSPYFFFGGGLNWYDPMARLGNEWVKLRPLHTEGQAIATEYRESAGFISTGIGVYLDAGPRWSFRFEWNHTALFTDHFDDIGGRFIDPVQLKGQMNERSYARLQEIYGLSRPWNGRAINQPGMIRGNPAKKDGFAGFSISICRVINRKRV